MSFRNVPKQLCYIISSIYIPISILLLFYRIDIKIYYFEDVEFLYGLFIWFIANNIVIALIYFINKSEYKDNLIALLNRYKRITTIAIFCLMAIIAR